jgi:hypothetical protein
MTKIEDADALERQGHALGRVVGRGVFGIAANGSIACHQTTAQARTPTDLRTVTIKSAVPSLTTAVPLTMVTRREPNHVAGPNFLDGSLTKAFAPADAFGCPLVKP